MVHVVSGLTQESTMESFTERSTEFATLVTGVINELNEYEFADKGDFTP